MNEKIFNDVNGLKDYLHETDDLSPLTKSKSLAKALDRVDALELAVKALHPGAKLDFVWEKAGCFIYVRPALYVGEKPSFHRYFKVQVIDGLGTPVTYCENSLN